jgi:hypothetical protein
MKGRRPGRPTKWVQARIEEPVDIGKPGVTFEVWTKWKRTRKKLGTLTVSVGGLRWWPHKATKYRQSDWDKVAEWFASQ